MIIKNIIKRLINRVSYNSTIRIINNSNEFKNIWDESLRTFPDFSQHFSIPTVDAEAEARIRMLISVETAFVKDSLDVILKVNNKPVTYADIGDSDGSVRYLLTKLYDNGDIDSVGINLQQQAVDKIKKLGLNAICINAMDLPKQGKTFDVVSLFETLEHLPDPIGFLKSISSIVNKELIISVPYLRKSRIGLQYLNDRWPTSEKATIENQHIFELSPYDWKKIMLHCGWKVKRERIIKAYPRFTYHRLLLEPYWRHMSFDGFWFVSLEKDSTISSRYKIE